MASLSAHQLGLGMKCSSTTRRPSQLAQCSCGFGLVAAMAAAESIQPGAWLRSHSSNTSGREAALVVGPGRWSSEPPPTKFQHARLLEVHSQQHVFMELGVVGRLTGRKRRANGAPCRSGQIEHHSEVVLGQPTAGMSGSSARSGLFNSSSSNSTSDAGLSCCMQQRQYQPGRKARAQPRAQAAPLP
jgi:hypothetical protein